MFSLYLFFLAASKLCKITHYAQLNSNFIGQVGQCFHRKLGMVLTD